MGLKACPAHHPWASRVVVALAPCWLSRAQGAPAWAQHQQAAAAAPVLSPQPLAVGAAGGVAGKVPWQLQRQGPAAVQQQQQRQQQGKRPAAHPRWHRQGGAAAAGAAAGAGVRVL
jgi:hypothetical protein